MDSTRRKNPGCLNLQVTILISYLISIISNFLLILIMYFAGNAPGYVALVFSVIEILLCLLSFKYYLTYTTNTIIRFRSSTRFFILGFVATGICYVIVFIIFIAKSYIESHIYFFGFAIIAWFVFHYLQFSLINQFITNLEGKSGVTMLERDFKELGSN